MTDSIGKKLGNIKGGKFRMNYINVRHLVRLYDECDSDKMAILSQLEISHLSSLSLLFVSNLVAGNYTITQNKPPSCQK